MKIRVVALATCEFCESDVTELVEHKDICTSCYDEMRFLRRELINLWIHRKATIESKKINLVVHIRKQVRINERSRYGQELKMY